MKTERKLLRSRSCGQNMSEIRARVISQEKGIYKITNGTAVKSAAVSGKYRYEAKTVSDYPAGGD